MAEDNAVDSLLNLNPHKRKRSRRLVPTPVRGSRASQTAAPDGCRFATRLRQAIAEEVARDSEISQAEAKPTEATRDQLAEEEDEHAEEEEEEVFDDYPLDPMDDPDRFEADLLMMRCGVQTETGLRRIRRYESFLNQPYVWDPRDARYGYVLACGHAENQHVKSCRVCRDHFDASARSMGRGRSRRAPQAEEQKAERAEAKRQRRVAQPEEQKGKANEVFANQSLPGRRGDKPTSLGGEAGRRL
jgi:hypothetical protein